MKYVERFFFEEELFTQFSLLFLFLVVINLNLGSMLKLKRVDYRNRKFKSETQEE